MILPGCLVHLDVSSLPGPRKAELYAGAASLVARLHQQGVPPALLVQCSSATEAAACLAVLQPAADEASAPLSLTQPGQLSVAVRLGLNQLSPAPPSAIAFVSVSDCPSAASQASALGSTAVEQLPARSASSAQLQAWALQAVASLAASRSVVPPIVVGYVMKESRQLALSQQGMLPLLPRQPPLAQAAAGPSQQQQQQKGSEAAAAAGLQPLGVAAGAAQVAGKAGAVTPTAAAEAAAVCFVPLDLGSSLPHQLRRCHVVLQKLTDCLQPSNGDSGSVAALTPEAEALLELLGRQGPGQQAHHGQHLSSDQEQQQQHSRPPANSSAGHQPAAQASTAAQHALPEGSLPLCLVDPAEALLPIMDRAALIPYLEAAALAVRQRAIPMRAPASLLLLHGPFDTAATPRQLAAAGVGLPCIVKPQAACGVAEAHQMAFVLHGSGFADLEVPLPAVAQEYVDHGGVVWKVYVAGEQVFWTQRKSTPDLGPLARRLLDDPEADIPSSIGFDSLKSLPTTLPWLRHLPASAPAPAAAAAAVPAGAAAAVQPGQQVQQAAHGAQAAHGQEQAQKQAQGQQMAQQAQQPRDAATSAPIAAAPSPPQGGPPPSLPPNPDGHELMRRPTFEVVAAALRQRLGLTLFGFDLVFDRSAGELVIVDINYFPSFKGIPEAPAALQAALRQRYQQHLAAL